MKTKQAKRPSDDAKCYIAHIWANPSYGKSEIERRVYTMDQIAYRHGNLVWTQILALDTKGLWLLIGDASPKAYDNGHGHQLPDLGQWKLIGKSI